MDDHVRTIYCFGCSIKLFEVEEEVYWQWNPVNRRKYYCDACEKK